MPTLKTIETVTTNFKKLKPSQKNYVLGVMQGFLIAREPQNKISEHQEHAAN